MYTQTCTYTQAHMYTHTEAYMPTCVYTHVSAHTYTHAHTLMHTNTNTHTHMHAQLQPHMRTLTHTKIRGCSTRRESEAALGPDLEVGGAGQAHKCASSHLSFTTLISHCHTVICHQIHRVKHFCDPTYFLPYNPISYLPSHNVDSLRTKQRLCPSS